MQPLRMTATPGTVGGSTTLPTKMLSLPSPALIGRPGTADWYLLSSTPVVAESLFDIQLTQSKLGACLTVWSCQFELFLCHRHESAPEPLTIFSCRTLAQHSVAK